MDVEVVANMCCACVCSNLPLPAPSMGTSPTPSKAAALPILVQSRAAQCSAEQLAWVYVERGVALLTLMTWLLLPQALDHCLVQT